ncbi:hypothetical protein [Actinocatenispora rupis]|uniref:Uncharacterized protein n=1 Tax=Actinocatenispora rupis TaxID=519421 RepID=A0A8J3IYI3_9ACTN|nr:hypothetical protein [Actinocatenispora rupis]GID12386.1 hypothetical protein Aru02nite_32750 [Actinocatenispora rupis]
MTRRDSTPRQSDATTRTQGHPPLIEPRTLVIGLAAAGDAILYHHQGPLATTIGVGLAAAYLLHRIVGR